MRRRLPRFSRCPVPLGIPYRAFRLLSLSKNQNDPLPEPSALLSKLESGARIYKDEQS